MAIPDISGMSTADLALLIEAAQTERNRRGQFDETHAYLLDALKGAKEMGITKAQVATFLTNVVNEVYPVV